MERERTSVGLDVHARSVVACGIDGDTGEVFRARLTPDPEVIFGWLRHSHLDDLPEAQQPGQQQRVPRVGLHTVPGRALHLRRRRHHTPDLPPAQEPGQPVPGRPGLIDHRHRARQLPTLAQEAARDLVRAREDVRGDLMRARHRTSKLLLRQGIIYAGGTAWTTVAHHDWLRRQSFDSPALAVAYDTALETVLLTADGRDHLDKTIVELAADPAWSPTVTRRSCLRGISTLTAFGLAVEVGDWTRFTGNTIGAFLGLVPTEHSSGGSRSQGSITKAGNTHARRLLVDAARHHKQPYRTPSKTMRDRWEQAPGPARARGHAGNIRLHQRWLAFQERKKRPVIANVAVARELAGWCWSFAVLADNAPSGAAR